jgi:predicted permease
MMSDFRFALRSLLREPGVAAAAVLMLGLGLGAATAVFSLVNGVLLKPLSYRAPERLVTIREVIPRTSHLYPSMPVSGRHFVEFRAAARSIEGMAALEPASLNLTGAGEPERLEGARVSPNLFRVLGVRPALGRDFLDEEEQEGKDYVVVLTDGLWRRRFAADPGVVGRAITLNGRAHTVIGVLPPDIRFPDRNAFGMGSTVASRTDLFRPKTFDKQELSQLLGMFNYGVIARLRPGATRAQATAELEAVQARIEELAGEKLNMKAEVKPLLDAVAGKARRGLLVLMGAIGVVLLIVCVNLANLLLARGERRSREAAVRAALGAGRGRLIRQALAETALLGAAGGLLALGVAAAGIHLLKAYAPVDIPRLEEVAMDGRVALFAGVLTAFTALVFGLLPAWRVSGADPQAALRSGGRGATESPGGMRLRSALVACEVGLSALLLILAGLLTHSFVRLMRAEMGFRGDAVLSMDVGLSGDRYRDEAARDGFFKRVFENLQTQPAVETAGIVSALPLRGETWIDGVRSDGEELMTNVRFVSAEYFRVMGIPVLGGRTFRETDRGTMRTVISAGLAAALWPGQDPVGRRFLRGRDQWWEVVGVAGDVRAEAHRPAPPVMYRPYWDWMPFRTVLVARSAGDPKAITGAVRAAVRAADPDIPIPQMRSMPDVLGESTATRRFQMVLAGGFAIMALLVASLGIYAVVSYSVARRTAEMGIRAALGAGRADLYALVLRQGMAPVLAGLLFAAAAAAAFGRALGSLLYEIDGRDPATIAAVTLALGAVALAACLIPARRASRVDPMTALRYE